MRNQASDNEMVGVNVPILFLTFNRPEETRASFQAIRESKPQVLFIASDGPREGNAQDVLRVAEVRKIIQDIDWDCRCEYLFRDTNLGCGLGVSGALNWFFEKVECGIILEDDCLPNASFYLFCQDMLNKYRDDESVMAIAGTNVTRKIHYNSDYIFSSFPIMWGWATWRRAWKKYDYQIKKWPAVKKEKSLSRDLADKWKLHPVYVEFFDRTYEGARDGSINTWDHQWVFCNWINFGLTVTSTKNLVKNIGFSKDATHTFIDDLGRANLDTELSLPPYIGPTHKKPHSETDLYIGRYWFTATWVYYAKIVLLRITVINTIWCFFKKILKLRR